MESPVKIIQSSRAPRSGVSPLGMLASAPYRTHAALAPVTAAPRGRLPTSRGPSVRSEAGRRGPKRYARDWLGKFPNRASGAGLQLARNRGVVTVINTARGGDRMRLVLQLVARLLVVVILCLGAATVWATIDAYRSVDRATAASAERVSQALEALYWRELLLRSNRTREHLLPVPEWRTIETMKLISPGICVQFEPAGAFEKPLCGQSKGIGKPPPLWFAATVQTLLGTTRRSPGRSASRSHDRRHRLGHRRSGRRDLARLAAHPGQHPRRAADGGRRSRFLPRLRSRIRSRRRSRSSPHCSAWRTANTGHRCRASARWNLPMIGQAVGDLGERLAQATEERAVLTRRLLEIRDDERRALARELHDEFGQNLSAILAFANTIEAAGARGSGQERRVAQDARMISQATLRIMACLRDTLNRLRHPPPRNSGWKPASSAWSTAGDRRMRRSR